MGQSKGGSVARPLRIEGLCVDSQSRAWEPYRAVSHASYWVRKGAVDEVERLFWGLELTPMVA